jgi:UPF0755 protein
MISTVIRLLFLFGALAVCLAAAVAVYGLLGNLPSVGRLVPSEALGGPVSDTPSRVAFTIAPGRSAAEVGEELQRQGVIRSALAFKWEVESRGLGSKLEAGDYELSPSMSVSEVVGVLARGALARGNTFTVLEGWRAEQIAQRLEEGGLLKADEFLTLVRSPREAGLTPPDPAAHTLEGFLFPDTYEVSRTATPAEIVSTMVQEFERRYGDELKRSAAGRGLTLSQAVTLASIVEREAAHPEERPVISSVYRNRLQAGMRLEADPTVQYAVANLDLRDAGHYGFWKDDLTVEDLKTESPYNTYRVGGLPPTPICNPGLDSLRAAAVPAATQYLFFVARGDGSHAFATTAEEHFANVQRFR